MRDALPFAPFGELVLPFIEVELRRIFEFRQRAILETFPQDL
jgi:hypothetical protein